jgi:hypothetical protein
MSETLLYTITSIDGTQTFEVSSNPVVVYSSTSDDYFDADVADGSDFNGEPVTEVAFVGPDGSQGNEIVLLAPIPGTDSNYADFFTSSSPLFTGSLTDPTLLTGTFVLADQDDIRGGVPVPATLTVTAICYYPGTGIRTPHGDVAVEKLKIGDDVITADGRVMPVRWIGRNTVSTRFADRLRVLPIRIRAGALAENRPERDLLVSPEHAVLVEDILIQAGALVNGVSILREREVPETFIYYHVELAEHALILAEGAAAESFVDNIHRSAFDNWEEHDAIYGDTPITEMDMPRAQSHRQVPAEIAEAIRARAIGMAADAA